MQASFATYRPEIFFQPSAVNKLEYYNQPGFACAQFAGDEVKMCQHEIAIFNNRKRTHNELPQESHVYNIKAKHLKLDKYGRLVEALEKMSRGFSSEDVKKDVDDSSMEIITPRCNGEDNVYTSNEKICSASKTDLTTQGTPTMFTKNYTIVQPFPKPVGVIVETPDKLKISSPTTNNTSQPPPLLFRPSGIVSDSEDDEDEDIEENPREHENNLERTCSCPNLESLQRLNKNRNASYRYHPVSPYSNYRSVIAKEHQLPTPCINEDHDEEHDPNTKERATSCPPRINSVKCDSYLLPQQPHTQGLTMVDEKPERAHSTQETVHSSSSTAGSTERISASRLPLFETKKLKQEKNKEASKNYRDRKKRKHNETLKREVELKSKNRLLKTQIKDIEQDIAAFENDLAKKIDTKEKIKRQICTLLLRDLNGYSRDVDVERNIMQRILEKITRKNGELVKQAFYEVWTGVSKSNKQR